MYFRSININEFSWFMCKGYLEIAVFYLFLESTASFYFGTSRRASVVLGLTKLFTMKRALFFCHSKNNYLNTWHNKCLRDTLFYESIFFSCFSGYIVNHAFVLMVFLKKQYV